MHQTGILLTVKDILDKEFKIDTKGYRPQEVDKFLDFVIKDYEEFIQIIKKQEAENKELIDDNIRLKQELRNFKTQLDVVRESTNEKISNTDILRRLSNIEKVIYGKEEN
jgi:DivIVA domain-containing protein